MSLSKSELESYAEMLVYYRHALRRAEKGLREVDTAEMDFIAADLIRAQAAIRRAEEVLSRLAADT